MNKQLFGRKCFSKYEEKLQKEDGEVYQREARRQIPREVSNTWEGWNQNFGLAEGRTKVSGKWMRKDKIVCEKENDIKEENGESTV